MRFSHSAACLILGYVSVACAAPFQPLQRDAEPRSLAMLDTRESHPTLAARGISIEVDVQEFSEKPVIKKKKQVMEKVKTPAAYAFEKLVGAARPGLGLPTKGVMVFAYSKDAKDPTFPFFQESIAWPDITFSGPPNCNGKCKAKLSKNMIEDGTGAIIHPTKQVLKKPVQSGSTTDSEPGSASS